MDSCPAEILDRILALACTDDGTTGRALSMVSTRVRDASYPHKYFSVHVTGPARIARFTPFIQKYHPPIQYLLLDCTPPGSHGPSPSAPDAPSGPQGQSGKQNTDINAPSTERNRLNTWNILHVLSHTIAGLYLIPLAEPDMPLIWNGLTFPRLETLYVYGWGKSHELSVRWEATHFPALKRLNVSCHNMSTSLGYGLLFSNLRIPTLTHFGCCAHEYEGTIFPSMFLDVFGGGPIYEMKSVKIAHELLTLKVFRQAIPPQEISDVCEYISQVEVSKELPKQRPKFLLEAHRVGDGVQNLFSIPMDEWNYIVQGGEGFLPHEAGAQSLSLNTA